MNKENIDCVINIFDDEIFKVLPIIGSICDTSTIPINIVKCNISCRTCNHLKLNTFINWDNISILFKRYNSLKILENKKDMPDYADIYITTHYVPSHITRRQYNKYVLLYYDTKQLTTTNELGETIPNDIIDNIFRFNSVILANDVQLLRNVLIDNEHNEVFLRNNCVEADRRCIKSITSMDMNYKFFHNMYNKYIWQTITDELVLLLDEIIVSIKCTQIIDLSCNNVKLAKPYIKSYHCNNINKDILKTIRFNTHTKFTLSNNNISNEKFTDMISTLGKEKTIIISHNMFQYMPFEEIINTIQNLCTIDFAYISITSIQTMIKINNEWLEINTNKNDISYGGYRAINLNNAPYGSAIPYKIYYHSQFINQENNYREDEYIHIYTFAEFKKLKKIDDKFIEHAFIKYDNKYNYYKDNKYVIYELKDIDKMYDNVYNNRNTYYISQ